MLNSFNRFFSNDSKEKNDSIKEAEIVHLPVAAIIPNEFQPRKVFEDEKISELAQTLKTHGIIQPIVVRVKDADTYEVIAGERRLRAAKSLEWETIPAIIREFNDTETASVALIENIQREQLSVIEEATAYVKLLELHDLTQEALAQRLGKSQSTVANRIRLLKLTPAVQAALIDQTISERHARTLLKLTENDDQELILNQIVEEKLNVQATEELIKRFLGEVEEKPKKRKKPQFVSKDIRIATNTIKESIKLISQTGIKVEAEEEDLEDYYQVTIKIKK